MSISAEDLATDFDTTCDCNICDKSRRKAAFIRSLERIRVAAEYLRVNQLQTPAQFRALFEALDAHRKEFGSLRSHFQPCVVLVAGASLRRTQIGPSGALTRR